MEGLESSTKRALSKAVAVEERDFIQTKCRKEAATHSVHKRLRLPQVQFNEWTGDCLGHTSSSNIGRVSPHNCPPNVQFKHTGVSQRPERDELLRFGCRRSSLRQGMQSGTTMSPEVRTLNPLSLELPCASWRLQLGRKHASPRENVFFFFASAFRPVRPGRCIVLSLSLCTTSDSRPGPGGSRTVLEKMVLEASCQNGRLRGAAVTAEVRTLNPLSLELLCASWRLQLGGNRVSPRKMVLEVSKAATVGAGKVATQNAAPKAHQSPCKNWIQHIYVFSQPQIVKTVESSNIWRCPAKNWFWKKAIFRSTTQVVYMHPKQNSHHHHHKKPLSKSHRAIAAWITKLKKVTVAPDTLCN